MANVSSAGELARCNEDKLKELAIACDRSLIDIVGTLRTLREEALNALDGSVIVTPCIASLTFRCMRSLIDRRDASSDESREEASVGRKAAATISGLCLGVHACNASVCTTGGLTHDFFWMKSFAYACMTLLDAF